MNNNEKIEICFLINGFGEGGAQKQCIILLNELQNNPKFVITLIHFFDGVYFPLLNKERIDIVKLKKLSFYDPRNIIKIHAALPKNKDLIVFSWMRSSDFYAYFLKLLNRKIKWVLAERNSNYPNSILFKLRSKMGKYSNFIISNSKQGKLYWHKHGAIINRVAVVPNVISFDKSISNLPVDMSTNSIVYAGRFEPQKNVINMTHALCNVAKSCPETSILLIGSGTLEGEIRSIIKNSDVNNIVILPFKKNILDYFKHLAVFISISHYEGMPNTVLENAILRNKIVVSKIPEHVHLLGENYPYYINDINCIEEITEQVVFALNDSEENIMFNYFDNVSKDMNLENVISAYTNIFEELHEGHL